MRYIIFIFVLVLAIPAHAVDTRRNHTAGNFAQEIDGSGKGMVQPVEGGEHTSGDIETKALSTMMQTGRDSSSDLKDQLKSVKDTNTKKKALRENTGKPGNLRPATPQVKSNLNAPGNAAEIARLRAEKKEVDRNIADLQKRLQQQMERRSKVQETLSNLLKKSSDTSDTITKNMK